MNQRERRETFPPATQTQRISPVLATGACGESFTTTAVVVTLGHNDRVLLRETFPHGIAWRQ